MKRRSSAWPIVYPRSVGPWTVRNGDAWGILDPESGTVDAVDPSLDRRLPGLGIAMRMGHLVGYRWGRRAVVATPTSFIKVVRPTRVDRIVRAHQLLGMSGGSFNVPEVIEARPDGRVTLCAAPGRSLHANLRGHPRRPFCDIAAMLVELHTPSVSTELAARHHDDPSVWVAISGRSPTPYREAIERVAADLPSLIARSETIVHGDLHDKNVFCDAVPDGSASSVGLIDLDGLAAGTPEDDVANLAVHLELRNIQGRTGLPFGLRSSALYRCYGRMRPLDAERLEAVERHTWFRLACLYQFRAGAAEVVPRLLNAASSRTGPEAALELHSDSEYLDC